MKLLKSELFHLCFSKFYATVTFQTRAMVWNDSVQPTGGGVLAEDGKKNCRINLRNFKNENNLSH